MNVRLMAFSMWANACPLFHFHIAQSISFHSKKIKGIACPFIFLDYWSFIEKSPAFQKKCRILLWSSKALLFLVLYVLWFESAHFAVQTMLCLELIYIVESNNNFNFRWKLACERWCAVKNACTDFRVVYASFFLQFSVRFLNSTWFSIWWQESISFKVVLWSFERSI